MVELALFFVCFVLSLIGYIKGQGKVKSSQGFYLVCLQDDNGTKLEKENKKNKQVWMA